MDLVILARYKYLNSLIGSYNNDSLDAQLLSIEKEAVQLMEINGKE